MKIIILGASFNTQNLGVGALTAGTIKAALHQYPDAEIFLLDYGKESKAYHIIVNGRIIPIQLINIRFSKKFYLKNNIALLIFTSLLLKVIPFQKLKNKLICRNDYLAKIFEADVVVAISGGDSFSDIYGFGRLIYVTLPQVLTLLLGKNLVLLPQTLGPFKSWIARKAAMQFIQRATIVYSRDYDGIREMNKLLHLPQTEKIRFCYDVGFILDPAKPSKLELVGAIEENRGGNSPFVGLNISGLLYRGGYTGNNMFGLKVDYKDFIHELIDFMIRKKNAAVMLVPHVFGSHGESDVVVCEEVFRSLKEDHRDRLQIVRGEYNQNEIKYIIGLTDFFIGSRMHACIAALSQNVPTVSIAYSRKFIGVMETIGVEKLVADPRHLKKEEILKIIDDAFERNGSIREHLEKTMPIVKETVLNLFNEIRPLHLDHRDRVNAK